MIPPTDRLSTYNRYNKGPNSESCGTPVVTFPVLLISLFTIVNQDRLLRNEDINLKAGPRIPSFFNFNKR